MPTTIDISLAPQWSGEPNTSSAPAPMKSRLLQPLTSRPMNCLPLTAPLGGLAVKPWAPPMSSARIPNASSARPMISTGPFASETPLCVLFCAIESVLGWRGARPAVTEDDRTSWGSYGR